YRYNCGSVTRCILVHIRGIANIRRAEYPSFEVGPCATPPRVRPLLAHRDPAQRRPNPAGPATSTASAAAASAAAPPAAPYYCTTSAASRCATSATSCCAASAASAASRCNFFGELGRCVVFLVEDIERRQVDVENFLLIERNFRKRSFVLRR